MTIRYSPGAAPALAKLKAYYNSIDIFVEDKSGQQVWLALLRRCVRPEHTLSSVNVLGGREAVLAACRRDQAKGGRPRLYIIDGDYDFLLEKPKPRMRYLYRLRAYCVENILINEAAAVSAACVSDPSKLEGDIRAAVAFAAWVSSTLPPLQALFAVYAAAFSINSSIKTVGLPVEELYRNTAEGPAICEVKTARRMRAVARQACRASTLVEFSRVLRSIRGRLDSLVGMQVVSGKDYLLPVFYLRLRRIAGFKGSEDQLKALLASAWSTSNEPWLARRLKAL